MRLTRVMRLTAAFGLVAFLSFYRDGALLTANGSLAAAIDRCDEICNGGSDCAEPCLYVPEPPYESVEITCGDYDGGGANGKCVGECGDSYCNGYNNIENMYNCADDCASVCTDQFCSFDENCSNCSADCGACPVGSPSCDPNDPEDSVCNGDFCNTSGSCCEGTHVLNGDCSMCSATEEVCRPGANGHVICITRGENCTIS